MYLRKIAWYFSLCASILWPYGVGSGSGRRRRVSVAFLAAGSCLAVVLGAQLASWLLVLYDEEFASSTWGLPEVEIKVQNDAGVGRDTEQMVSEFAVKNNMQKGRFVSSSIQVERLALLDLERGTTITTVSQNPVFTFIGIDGSTLAHVYPEQRFLKGEQSWSYIFGLQKADVWDPTKFYDSTGGTATNCAAPAILSKSATLEISKMNKSARAKAMSFVPGRTGLQISFFDERSVTQCFRFMTEFDDRTTRQLLKPTIFTSLDVIEQIIKNIGSSKDEGFYLKNTAVSQMGIDKQPFAELTANLSGPRITTRLDHMNESLRQFEESSPVWVLLIKILRYSAVWCAALLLVFQIVLLLPIKAACTELDILYTLGIHTRLIRVLLAVSLVLFALIASTASLILSSLFSNRLLLDPALISYNYVNPRGIDWALVWTYAGITLLAAMAVGVAWSPPRYIVRES